MEARQVTIVAGCNASVDTFKIGDNWEIYEERLEQLFAANLIEEERKVSVLLTSISIEVYEILRNTCDPVKPSSCTYEELVSHLTRHFCTKIPVYRRRIEFDNLRQLPQEKVMEWYVRLKKTASKCAFGNNMDEFLKNKFVTGMLPGKVQDRLCEEEASENLKRMVEIALNKEAVVREAGGGVDVNKLSKFVKKDKSARNFKKYEKTERKADRSADKTLRCFHCNGVGHDFKNCKFKTFVCNKCNIKGHISKACKRSDTNYVEKQTGKGNLDSEESLYNVTCDIDLSGKVVDVNYVKPIIFKTKINGKMVEMEVDTGAGISCMPFSIFKKKFNNVSLEPTQARLKTYSGQVILPKGTFNASVEIGNKTKECEIVVVEEATKVLLGRDILKLFNLIIVSSKSEVNSLSSTLEDLLLEYKDLFKEELGQYNGGKVSLEIKQNSKPIFHKHRPVPYAFKSKVEQELKRLEERGVITRIEKSQWGTTLVPVLKSDGKSIRVCANYKTTINPCLEDVNYPLPRIDEIFTALQGGEKFSKLDFRDAYNQLELDDKTAKVLAWSTSQGIYKVNRLPYGTKPACSIFQREIEKVLQGCRGTVNFLDDIMITGRNEREHLENLKEVLHRLNTAGFRLNLKKCEFFKESIDYLGHRISSEGLEKRSDKVKAILEAPRPKNIQETRSFLGLVNYYSKFIQNLAIKLRPLYELLNKNSEFKWTRDCDKAFECAKKEVASDKILVHYNQNKPLRLLCDASYYGIGAVLMQVEKDKTEKPICFISRVLTKAEKNYSMIHKEALSIYWAVNKLYQYLVGCKFELVSDHKPLQALFGEKKGLPQMAAGRLQRWSLFLSNFDYTFKYIKGNENVNADALSRLPLPEEDEELVDNFHYLNFVEDSLPIDTNLIRSETRKDSLLGKVVNFIRYGFPERVTDELVKPYLSRNRELSFDKGIVMWGYRVVVPISLREKLLRELHSTHEGIVKMKSNARSYFWWPSLDAQIESLVNNCKVCTQVRPEPKHSKIISCQIGSRFFERVRADFLGPFHNRMILIIVDTYTKWPEAFIMSRTDTLSTIEKFREVFARFGLPEVLATDNGSQFTSDEFSKFLYRNGIRHISSPPFHPQSNGFAENSVKSFKIGLTKALKDPGNVNVSFETLMNRYLFHYRNSVHITTGVTPSSLIFKNKIRTRLDLLQNSKQVSKEIWVDKRGRDDRFSEGEKVYCRDYRSPNKKRWVPCVIDERLGERIYLCKLLDENVIWKRHLDQIIRVLDNSKLEEKECVGEKGDFVEPKKLTIQHSPLIDDKFVVDKNMIVNSDVKQDVLEKDRCNLDNRDVTAGNDSDVDIRDKGTELPKELSSKRERPKRNVKPPDRLNL